MIQEGQGQTKGRGDEKSVPIPVAARPRRMIRALVQREVLEQGSEAHWGFSSPSRDRKF
jgi:hypothetical protein